MNFDYSRKNIHLGSLAKQNSEETPTNFATLDSASQHRPARDLDITSKRMAGQALQGQRALQLLNDPVEKERTESFRFMLNSFAEKNIPYDAQNRSKANFINEG